MARRVPLLIALLAALPASAFLTPPASAEGHAKQDLTIASFDGTPLAATLFVPAGADAAHRVPYVLMTHGWAGSRQTEVAGRVADLLDAGYGVLTWDSRGFGASGGEVQLNSPAYEVQDVRALITWLTGHAPVEMRGGDPAIGMSGGSYAGGIQLLAAAFDGRIDAITPEITWNDLNQALAPNGVPKLYWTSLLLGSGQAASCADLLHAQSKQDPQVVADALAAGPGNEARRSSGCQTSNLARWYAMVHATHGVPAEVREALAARSPATYMDAIRVPTLLVQGAPDTLFDLSQAVANFEGIRANGAPAKLWVYDGGHSHPEAASLVPNTQGGLISGQVVAWLDCHLKLPADCSGVGAPVEYWTGSAWKTGASWPPEGVEATRHVNGLPPLLDAPAAPGEQGSATIPLPRAGPYGSSGAVRVAFDVRGSAPESFLFASLAVVDAAGVATTVNGQVQPLRVPTGLGADPVRVELDLVDVLAEVPAGGRLALVLATSHRDYAGPRVPGTVNLDDIDVTFRVDA